MTRRQRVFAAAAFGAAVAAGPALPAAHAQVAATAGPVKVSAAELRTEVRLLRQSGSLTAMASTRSLDGLEGVVRAMVDRKLLAAEARRTGLDAAPDTALLVTRATDEVLAGAAADEAIRTLDVSPGALRAFFDANVDQFRSTPRRRVRHVVVATEAAAIAARAALDAGEPFADVATRLNTDTTRSRGGDLGWVARGTMTQTFDTAVFATPAGTVGGPVKTAKGWHLVFVEEVDPGTIPPLDLVVERVVEAMRADAVARLRRTLREQHPVQLERSVLETLLNGAVAR